ncbi:MAG: hypothetical protein WBC71_09875, partial [Salaquimonas sp.]
MKKLLLLSFVLPLAGCQEYLVRSDLVNPHSGDAVARNTSNQTIDPWPKYVYDTEIQTSSERQKAAIASYNAGPVKKSNAPASPAILVPQS